jgi:hypothetical protein
LILISQFVFKIAKNLENQMGPLSVMTWWISPEVETCILRQDNVYSSLLDGTGHTSSQLLELCTRIKKLSPLK